MEVLRGAIGSQRASFHIGHENYTYTDGWTKLTAEVRYFAPNNGKYILSLTNQPKDL